MNPIMFSPFFAGIAPKAIGFAAKHLTPEETQNLENRVEMIVQKGSRSGEEILSLLKGKLDAIKEVTAP